MSSTSDALDAALDDIGAVQGNLDVIAGAVKDAQSHSKAAQEAVQTALDSLDEGGGGGGGPTPPEPGVVMPTPADLAGLSLGLKWAEEFDGTAVNTGTWNTQDGYKNKNNCTVRAANAKVHDGLLELCRPSKGEGAEIASKATLFAVGDIIEYKVRFPGSGATQLYNWPAVWTSGPGWPKAGEYDWAEVLAGGKLTMNIHGYYNNANWTSNGAQPSSKTNFANAYMTVTGQRLRDTVNTWWNQEAIRKGAATHDNGAAQNVILTNGENPPAKYGADGSVFIEYVRIWTPR